MRKSAFPLVALVVLDGWGCAPPGPGNAVELAATPVFDGLWARFPHTTLSASGTDVGLPPGQMGNSEVGHLTIGAGRIVDQDFMRVNRAIERGAFYANPALVGVFGRAKERGTNVHLLGPRPYETMPRYAKAFDVCVLPWTMEKEFVRYGSAIKVREYMATGKPVVITPLPEYESFGDIIAIARTPEVFIDGVEKALGGESGTRRAARLAAVKDDTWDARAEEVSDLIETVLSA